MAEKKPPTLKALQRAQQKREKNIREKKGITREELLSRNERAEELRRLRSNKDVRSAYTRDSTFRQKFEKDEQFRKELRSDSGSTIKRYNTASRLLKRDEEGYTSTSVMTRYKARIGSAIERKTYGLLGGLGEAMRQGRRAGTAEEAREIRRDYFKRSVANALERTFGIAGEAWAARIRQNISRIRSDDPKQAFMAVKNNFANVASAIDNIEKTLEKHNKRIRQAFDRVEDRTKMVLTEVDKKLGHVSPDGKNFKDEVQNIKSTVDDQDKKLTRIDDITLELRNKFTGIDDRVDRLEAVIADLKQRQTVHDNDNDDSPGGYPAAKKKDEHGIGLDDLASIGKYAAAGAGALAIARKSARTRAANVLKNSAKRISTRAVATRVAAGAAVEAAKKSVIRRIYNGVQTKGVQALIPILYRVLGKSAGARVAIAIGGVVGFATSGVGFAVIMGALLIYDLSKLSTIADELEKDESSPKGSGYTTGGTMENAETPVRSPLRRPSTNQTIDDRIYRNQINQSNKQFMQFGKLPEGFEFLQGHMGRLGHPAAVAAAGAMPLGGGGGFSASGGGSWGAPSYLGGPRSTIGTPSNPYSFGGRTGGSGESVSLSQDTGRSNITEKMSGMLGEDRARAFAQELEQNPKLAHDLYSRAYREVGSNPTNQQMWIETAVNRAMFSGRSLNSVVNDSRYFPAVSMQPVSVSPEQMKTFRENVLGGVMKGSDLTNLATDNASADVAVRREAAGVTGAWRGVGKSKEFYYTSNAGRYMTSHGKAADAYRQRMALAESKQSISSMGGKFFMSQEGYSEAELQQIAKSSPNSYVMGDPNWGSKYDKMLGEAKAAGVKMHDYYEGRGGPTGSKWDPGEWDRINKERIAYNKMNGENFTMEEWRKNGNYLNATHNKILNAQKRGVSSYEIDNMEFDDINTHMLWRRQAGVTSKFMPKNLSEEQIAQFKKANPDWEQHVTPFAFSEHGTYKNKDAVKSSWGNKVTPVFAGSYNDTYNYRHPGGRMEGAAFGAPTGPVTTKAEAQSVISSAISGKIDPRSAVVDSALKMEGLHESRDRETLKKYLRSGGTNIDPSQTPWCSAFVNSALANAGMKGTGSLVATSYMNWGELKNAADTQKGDVLVEPRGRAPGETGGHVGLATGEVKKDAQGRVTHVEMFGGNQSNMTTRKWVPVNAVMARRATEGQFGPVLKEAMKLSANPVAAVRATEGPVPAVTEASEAKPLDADTPGITPGEPQPAVTGDDMRPVEQPAAPAPTPMNEMESLNDANNAAAIDAINAATPEPKMPVADGPAPTASEPRGTTEGGVDGGGIRHNPESRGSSPGSGGYGSQGRCFLAIAGMIFALGVFAKMLYINNSYEASNIESLQKHEQISYVVSSFDKQVSRYQYRRI